MHSRLVVPQTLYKKGPLSQKENYLKQAFQPVSNKSAPPLPTKPPHLLRNSVTPPPVPDTSTVLGSSASSLPEHELSDFEHPQHSSTLKPLSTSQPENMHIIKPPKPPVRRESMRQNNESVIKKDTNLPRKQVRTVTSLEESFSTRFKPPSSFPAPIPFTNCVKTYPSKEPGALGRTSDSRKSTAPTILPVASTIKPTQINPEKPQVSRRKPNFYPPPPPLPKTSPPLGNGSSMFSEPLQFQNSKMIVPPAPPLQEAKHPPPRPPLPSIIPCPPPLPLNKENISKALGKVPTSSQTHQSKGLFNCESSTIKDSPISTKKIARSGFAENLAEIYLKLC